VVIYKRTTVQEASSCKKEWEELVRPRGPEKQGWNAIHTATATRRPGGGSEISVGAKLRPRLSMFGVGLGCVGCWSWIQRRRGARLSLFGRWHFSPSRSNPPWEGSLGIRLVWVALGVGR